MRLKSLQLSGVGPFTDTTIEFPAGDNGELADVYLLVGQNGCGKTTALHTIASMLFPPVGGGLRMQQRMTSRRAFARLASHGPEAWELKHRVGLMAESAFGLQHLLPAETVDYFGPAPHVSLGSLERQDWARWFRVMNSGEGQHVPGSLAWAAFAYAGARSVGDVSVTSIQEMNESPLSDALGFAGTANSQRLAQWVANQDFKRLKAESAGLTERAQQIRYSVQLIEQSIKEVIDTDFSFYTTVDDMNVRAKLGDTVVDFALLPEGVKSIVSWIADLLMRMDNIAWVDNLPIHQREFLLLLDEIDVHLHPAWQRKLLPAVQKIFPKAQIIASTHSPFVVASLADGAVIELRLDANGKSTAQPPVRAPLSMSYSATLRELFGITSDFDLETEKALKDFQETRTRVLKGEPGAQAELERRADELKTRGEEVAQVVQFELNQLARARRPAGS